MTCATQQADWLAPAVHAPFLSLAAFCTLALCSVFCLQGPTLMQQRPPSQPIMLVSASGHAPVKKTIFSVSPLRSNAFMALILSPACAGGRVPGGMGYAGGWGPAEGDRAAQGELRGGLLLQQLFSCCPGCRCSLLATRTASCTSCTPKL
jgi:hypothetical protein